MILMQKKSHQTTFDPLMLASFDKYAPHPYKMHKELWSNWNAVHHIAGAILAIGRGGRETTLWPVQK